MNISYIYPNLNYFYYRTYIKKGSVGTEIEHNCNITLKGNYNATALTKVIPGLSSEGILKADGNMKVKISMIFLLLCNSFCVNFIL